MTTRAPAPPPLDAGLEGLLRRMRLPHIRRAAPEVLATAKAQRWDPAEVLRVLLTEEVAGRDRSALATRRARAAFPTGKTFAAWDEALSSIPAPTQTALRTLEWIGRHENLVVCGPSGTGKTFLLEALGQAAVETGKHVAWFTLESLGVLIRRHRADDSLTKAITRILRAGLVIVNDIGAAEVGQVRRYGRVPLESWSEMGGDPECLPELGHVVAVVIGGFVALVEVDLLFRRQARDGGPQDRAGDEARGGVDERVLGVR